MTGSLLSVGVKGMLERGVFVMRGIITKVVIRLEAFVEDKGINEGQTCEPQVNTNGLFVTTSENNGLFVG